MIVLRKLTLRDLLATLITAAVVVPFAGYSVRGSVPFVQDPRGMTGVVIVGTVLAFAVFGRNAFGTGAFEIVMVTLGVLTLGFAIAALTAETVWALLVPAMADLVLMWALAILHDAGYIAADHPGIHPVHPGRRRHGATRHPADARRGSQVKERLHMKRDDPMPSPAPARHALHVLGTLGTALHGQTGFPQSDVEDDFLRARRRQVAARLAARLRHKPDSASRLLPLSEVTSALGNRGERRLGLQSIPLASIVGTLDARRDFDNQFRPTSNWVRARWERLALAQRRGEPIPPISVYRVGGQHFIEDGLHRVSIAAATHQKMIDAYVTEVLVNSPARHGEPAA